MQALSEEEDTVQVAPKASQAQAVLRLNSMRSSLKSWLKYRLIMDEAAMGKRKAKVPASVLVKTLPLSRDWKLEQRIAVQLHALLSESLDARTLPNPDVTKDPNSAVRLAKIAIGGKTPEEASAPSAVGFIPFIILGVLGLGAIVIMTKVSSDADVAKEKERFACIKAGACTDSGFWLKMGGIAVLGWVAWDKFGLKQLAGKARKKAGA